MADIVGIRVAGISAMNSASADWRTSITKLNFTSTKNAVRNAARGTGIENQIKTLLDTANNKIDSLANVLIKFESELSTLGNRYIKANSTSSSSLSSASRNINSLS